MVNLVFHLKSDEGHIERFSFDVYMSPLPIFTKIKQPFAWHISFLVRHLSKYSVRSVARMYLFFFSNFRTLIGNSIRAIKKGFRNEAFGSLVGPSYSNFFGVLKEKKFSG